MFLTFEMEFWYAGDRFEGDILADMLDPNWVDSSTSGAPLRLHHFMILSRVFYESIKVKREQLIS